MRAWSGRFVGGILAASMWLAVGCGGSHVGEISGEETLAETGGARADALRAASEEQGVPREILMAYGWQQGRLEIPELHGEAGEVEGTHAMVQRHGWMQLTDAQLDEAAALLGVEASSLADDLLGNTRAAAALLKKAAGANGDTAVSWEQWLNAAARLSGLEDPELAKGFTRDVSMALGDGLLVKFDDGEVLQLEPVEGLPAMVSDSLEAVDQSLTAPGAYPPMKWRAAHPNNYVAGRNGGTVKYVVIHMTEGSYYGTLSWFAQANPYQSSTQYVIKSSNGEITQMVGEANGSWHAGNNYYSMNSIGIEHEGYVSNLSAWFTEAMYQSSAKLVCAIAKKHKIPVDSQHIIGHFQIPNGKRISMYSPPATAAQWAANRYNYGGASNHFDPSYGTTAWNWPRYLGLIKACVDASNGVTTTPAPSGGTTAPQNPIKCSGSACWPGNDLVQGASGDRVYSLQTALVYLGFMDGAVANSGAGTFGPATKAAVSAFQKSVGLESAGYYGPLTATALGKALTAKMPPVPSANLWIGMSNAQVTHLQKLLIQVGYDLPATGYYGTMTRDAVKKFQAAHGMPNGDGSYGALTRMALAAHAKGF